MKIYKHCNQCWTSLILNENDLKNKPLKSIELIKIFNDTGYKINSTNRYVRLEQGEKNGK